jgi:hypothetical protein
MEINDGAIIKCSYDLCVIVVNKSNPKPVESHICDTIYSSKSLQLSCQCKSSVHFSRVLCCTPRGRAYALC